MSTGIGLLSGGLDSMLAVCVLKEQNIHVEAIAFITPFFGSANAQKAVKMLNVPLHVVDITDVHLQMLKQPRHGYGSGMNPCIDCHALMFRESGKLMQQWRADFLFSGEVLGERPMSQNKQSLRVVARDSGFEEYIIRPLSAKLLPITRPEQEGKIDRELLLDIQGRSRKRQMELAKQYGITEFPEPAGGCRLTEPNFSKRLRDLMAHHKDFSVREIELLKVGRHFRLHDQVKLIVGRNEQENEKIESLKNESDILIFPDDIPGPAVLIPVSFKDIPNKEEIIGLAASICARYSDASAQDPVSISIIERDGVQKVSVIACSEEITAQMII